MAWLREKILNPNGDRLAGGDKQVMPSFAGRIPEDELGTLIDFLKAYPTSQGRGRDAGDDERGRPRRVDRWFAGRADPPLPLRGRVAPA